MALRGIFSVTKPLAHVCAVRTTGVRMFSAAAPQELVSYTVDENGVALVLMNRAPVNSMNREFMAALGNTFEKLNNDKSVRAAVVASNFPSVYCAGLDLKELYGVKQEGFQAFWRQVQQTFLTLYTFPKPMVAAIRGHAPAGGCMLALTADYRIMSDNPKFKIGLNETKLGFAAPRWLTRAYMSTIGVRNAERFLALGLVLGPAEARSVGLIDEVVPDAEVVTTAKARVADWLAIDPQARALSKSFVRDEVSTFMRTTLAEDLKEVTTLVLSADVQRLLGAYAESLKKK